ncbi:MAG: hypothetical protein GWP91_07630, partial [Rhodobacterales bacterium]|nr:hypothetical protein [Rhodobacterales bacterium]
MQVRFSLFPLLALSISCDGTSLYAVDLIVPGYGPTAGQNVVEIHGSDFDKRVRVLFGDRIATEVEVMSSELLKVVVPRGVRGESRVYLQRGAREPIALDDTYWYEGGVDLALTSVTPREVPLEGGWAMLVGDGFTHDTEVLVGGQRVKTYEFVDDDVVRVQLPAGNEGWQNIVLNDAEVDPLVVDDAILFHEPRLQFTDAIPAIGVATGGETIRILGDDFTPYTTVMFGDRPAERVTWLSRTEVEVVTPSSFEGVVDLLLEDVTRPGVFASSAWTFLPVDGVDVSDVFPSDGPTGGGIEVTLTGQDFEPGMEVWFGPVRSHFVQIDSSAQARAVLPPHVDVDRVDIEVRNPSGDARTISGGFQFNPATGGVANPDPNLPYVVGAASLGPNHIEVTFSESMTRSEMMDISNYAIMGDFSVAAGLTMIGDYNDQVPHGIDQGACEGGIQVLSQIANPSPSGLPRCSEGDLDVPCVHSGNTKVVIPTLAQHGGLTYTIVAAGVTSQQGEPLQIGWDRAFNIADFVGSFESGTATDSDGDGISDALEQRGYSMEIVSAAGTVTEISTSSDPFKCDTDGDLRTDAQEWQHGSDPRFSDTDTDGLSDLEEYRWVSDPLSADSDGDGFVDGDEVQTYITHPAAEDTDGDGFDDYEELVLRNRNPRVADLPQLRISTGTVDFRLDVRYDTVEFDGTESSTEASQETSLVNSNGHTSEQSHGFDIGIGGSVSTSIGQDDGMPERLADIGANYSASTSHNFTSASVDEMSRASNELSSQSSALTTSREVTTHIEGASVVVDVSFWAVSDVAFSMTGVELTLLHRDPADPENLIPVATLLPADEYLEMYLGPGTPQRGPFVFSSDSVYPEQVRALMRDPANVVVQVANSVMYNEDGRELEFIEQDARERTATVIIDDGFLQTRHSIAAVGQVIGGTQEGIQLPDALAVVGYRQLDEVSPDPAVCRGATPYPNIEPSLCSGDCLPSETEGTTCEVCSAEALEVPANETCDARCFPGEIPDFHPCLEQTFAFGPASTDPTVNVFDRIGQKSRITLNSFPGAKEAATLCPRPG